MWAGSIIVKPDGYMNTADVLTWTSRPDMCKGLFVCLFRLEEKRYDAFIA